MANSAVNEREHKENEYKNHSKFKSEKTDTKGGYKGKNFDPNKARKPFTKEGDKHHNQQNSEHEKSSSSNVKAGLS